jgi:hypothetical protein
VVVLGEQHCFAGRFVEACLVPAFKEPTAIIAKALWSDQQRAIDAEALRTF